MPHRSACNSASQLLIPQKGEEREWHMPTPYCKWFQSGSCAHMVSLVGEIQNCRWYQATVVPCVRLLVRLAAVSDLSLVDSARRAPKSFGIESLYQPRIWVWLSLGFMKPFTQLSSVCHFWVSLALLISGLHIVGSWLTVLPHLGYSRTSSPSGWEKSLIDEESKVLYSKYLGGSLGSFHPILNKSPWS